MWNAFICVDKINRKGRSVVVNGVGLWCILKVLIRVYSRKDKIDFQKIRGCLRWKGNNPY